MGRELNNLPRQWTFLEYDALGEEQFNRLCLLLLKEEISVEVQPTNKKGKDYKHDAFLLPCDNKYDKKGLWWFQFKFKDFGRAINTGRNLKQEFKRDFKQELDEILKKKERIPDNYIIITNVELTGGDYSRWFIEEIIDVYSAKTPFIRCWDYSQLNTLLDKYHGIKKQFEEIIFGSLPTQYNKSHQKRIPKKVLHPLQNPKTPFFEKLSYMLNLISNYEKPQRQERRQTIEIIRSDNVLAWHFFKNLKDINWFPEIKNTLIKSIATQKGDAAVKFQLIDFLVLCSEKYSDNIIPLLTELKSNTKSHNILSAIVKILPQLKPSKKLYLNSVWKMLRELSEHQHPWIRREIPNALKSLANYDIDKSLNLIETLFLFNPPPRDVTQGSPTLALTFQGRDNENWVFEEAARVLRELMLDTRFSIKAFDLAIKLEIHSIKGKLEKEAGLTLDHSYIWLHDNDPIDKIEYEYEGRRRFALEIQKCLDLFAPSNAELTKQLFEKLLQHKYEVLHLAVIKTLIKHPAQYLNLIEKIVFDNNLWIVHNIRDYYLQTLIQKYLEIKQDRLLEFTQCVRSFKYNDDPKKTSYVQQALLASIPENLKTEETNEDLKQLEDKLRVPARIEKSYSVTSWNGPKPDLSFDDLRRKSFDDLVHIMVESTAGRRADPHDLSGLFADLIKEEPDKLPVLIDRMIGENIAPDFSGYMVSAYKEVKQSEPTEIFKVFWKLKNTDTWARIEIARYLNKELKNGKPPELILEQLEETKRVLFDLSEDENPRDDDNIKSNNPRPEDAITRGINSVRGIAVEALTALFYYFPNDEGIAEKLKSLSKDPTNAVKATLIYNLRHLIGKDYPLCKSIVQQFKDIRNPEIDFALIHYFSYMGPDKFKASLAFIKNIFKDTNEGIQELLGNLMGLRWTDGFNVKDLIDGIIKQSIGEKPARQALAFILESRLAGQIGIKKHKRIFNFLIPLLDPFSEPDIQVRERASFALSRDELRAEDFKILYANKIFNTILKDTSNIHAQSHMIKYLSKCVSKDISIEKCVELLHKQAMNIEGIWYDHLIVQKISNILRHVFKSPKIDRKTTVLANEIFDKGLERGWEEFYSLFYEFKQST